MNNILCENAVASPSLRRSDGEEPGRLPGEEGLRPALVEQHYHRDFTEGEAQMGGIKRKQALVGGGGGWHNFGLDPWFWVPTQ